MLKPSQAQLSQRNDCPLGVETQDCRRPRIWSYVILAASLTKLQKNELVYSHVSPPLNIIYKKPNSHGDTNSQNPCVRA